ncbi:MAG: ArsC family reductase [Halothiobacillaceae bacterium]
MITVYGIGHCDTVRKARRWLDQRGIDYHFHDYRKQGIDAERLARWMDRLGWETLVNRRGTTWRNLPEAVREQMDQRAAVEAACDAPTLLRRPVVESEEELLVGFDEQTWAERLA